MIELIPEPKHYSSYSLSVEEYNDLTELFNQSVPFAGTSGKYAFHKSVMYPRYKIRTSFEKYNLTNAKKRSIAKNETYADNFVINVEEIQEVLKNAKDFEGRKLFRYLYIKDRAKLKAGIDFYNYTKKSGKLPNIINFQDLASSLDCVNERLTIPKAEFLITLLKGDKASEKLGMETLTNYDLKRSLPALVYVFTHTGKGRFNDYWHSTAFKSFRERFRTLTGTYVESLSGDNAHNVYTYLVSFLGNLPDMTITEQEFQYLRKGMCEYMKDRAANNDVNLILPEESVILKFKPEQIIPDSEVETEDQIRESAYLEEEDSYTIVDDTN